MHADHDSKLRQHMQAIANLQNTIPFSVAGLREDQIEALKEAALGILEGLGAVNIEEAQPGWFRAEDGSLAAIEDIKGVGHEDKCVLLYMDAGAVRIHTRSTTERASFLAGLEVILARRRGRIITKDDVLKEGL